MEPQRRHVLEEFGLVQVSLVPRVLRRSTQLLFLQPLDSFAGLLHPASVRCQLAGEASGYARLCERAGGACTWAIWTAFHAREGVTPGFCEARVWRLGN